MMTEDLGLFYKSDILVRLVIPLWKHDYGDII